MAPNKGGTLGSFSGPIIWENYFLIKNPIQMALE